MLEVLGRPPQPYRGSKRRTRYPFHRRAISSTDNARSNSPRSDQRDHRGIGAPVLQPPLEPGQIVDIHPLPVEFPVFEHRPPQRQALGVGAHGVRRVPLPPQMLQVLLGRSDHPPTPIQHNEGDLVTEHHPLPHRYVITPGADRRRSPTTQTPTSPGLRRAEDYVSGLGAPLRTTCGSPPARRRAPTTRVNVWVEPGNFPNLKNAMENGRPPVPFYSNREGTTRKNWMPGVAYDRRQMM